MPPGPVARPDNTRAVRCLSVPVRESGGGNVRLLTALAIEIVVFGLLAPSFLTVANAFEVSRFSVELGLLAVAMTPVVITGGIDLSVGSMVGLAAVVFGIATQEWQLPAAAACVAALATGCAGGALNAVLIARFSIPPLIVTLGSLALFRGLAMGLTEGAKSYSGYSPGFLFFGQGYLGGLVPAQLPLFVIVLVAYAILLHRSVIGRAWYAIGFNVRAARYAGLPVGRRIGLAYVLSGLVSSLAAIVYVAHLGQARADAATGYELNAVTAVVLGGASVNGGRGTIWGSLFGLLVLAVLQNGLQLAAWPSELVGVLTGALLVGSIAGERWRAREHAQEIDLSEEEVHVKNSQVALLCGAILASGLLVASTNIWLVKSLTSNAGISRSSADISAQPGGGPAPTPQPAGRRLVVAMMPKAKGDPYFVSCRGGAEEAARELGVDLIWDGPTGLDAAKQNDLVESWITRRVDAIAVAVENRASISSVLRKARERGITVLTWDADAEPDARDFFVNQATPEDIGRTLTDEAARLLGGRGQFAIITGALSAANQNAWIAAVRRRLTEKYPNLTLAVIRPSDDDRDKAFSEAQTIMRANPDVHLLMAISAPAVPGAAEAVRQARRSDVRVIGLSLPNINKPYVHGDVVQTVVLWNTTNLGYLTVHAAALAARHALAPGAASLDAGRLGRVELRGQEIILGAPLIMNKDNIDKFDF
jgi:ribose/xylose/arabinose/galactoside ABC-type transport system permease subunit/ABC-type sugar transport system substrate-binding protein